MWFWALMASAFLAAFFLVATLAQVEAGARSKYRFLLLTFCFLALVAVLIINKPKATGDQVQNVEVHPPVSEVVTETEDVKKNTNTKKPPVTSKTEQNKSGDATVKNDGETDKSEYSDPLVEEIFQIKRQAEEKDKETVTGEPAVGEGVSSPVNGADSSGQQKDNSNNEKDQNEQPLKPPYKDPVLEQLMQLKQQAGETNKEPSEKAPGGESLPAAAEIKEQQNKEAKTRASVLVQSLNVRDKESLDGKVVASLNLGDTVEVLGKSETGDWSKIRLSSGETGWVMSKYLNNLP